MIISFFDFDTKKCPLCLVDSKEDHEYMNCKVCGTVFNKFSIIIPTQLEAVEESLTGDQEMN